jgi:hypothetical protein
MVSAASVLYSDGQMEAELKPGTFAARSLRIVRSGTDTLRNDNSHGAYAFRMRGDAAELLFNYLRFGHLKKMGPPREFHTNGTRAVKIERAEFACNAERLQNGGHLPMKIEYECGFAFDARGAARSLGTLEPRIRIADGFKDDAPRNVLHNDSQRIARRPATFVRSQKHNSSSVAKVQSGNSRKLAHLSCPACVPAVSIQNLTSSFEP